MYLFKIWFYCKLLIIISSILYEIPKNSQYNRKAHGFRILKLQDVATYRGLAIYMAYIKEANT